MAFLSLEHHEHRSQVIPEFSLVPYECDTHDRDQKLTWN
jgi:hypothetical protein